VCRKRGGREKSAICEALGEKSERSSVFEKGFKNATSPTTAKRGEGFGEGRRIQRLYGKV